MNFLTPRRKILLAVISIGLYLVISVWVGGRNRALLAAFTLLPISVMAVLYGVWGGLIAGILFWPAQDILLIGTHPDRFSFTYLRSDWAAHVVFLSVAVVVGYLTTLTRQLRREIGERQRVQNTLEKQVHQNQLLLNTTLDGYILADTAGQIIDVNPAYCAMTGYTAAELQQCNIRQVEVQLSGDEVVVSIQEMLSQGGARFQTRHRRKDGQPMDVDVSIAIMQPGGKPLVAAFVRDITQQKQAQQKLQEYAEHLEDRVAARTRSLQEAQEKLLRQERLAALGQLADGVSHELRNPLAVIANAAYYLKLVQPDAGSTIKEYLDLIDTEVRTATHILSELHDFADTPVRNRSQVTLNEFFTEALDHHPPPDDILVQNLIPDDLSPAFIDPEHLLRVLLEVLKNAYDAMPDGGRLRMTASLEGLPPDEMLRLDISDTGRGLTPEGQTRAFEPLFSTKSRGLGLGLALCRILMKANDARIEISGQPEQGTTVSLWLAVPLDGRD